MLACVLGAMNPIKVAVLDVEPDHRRVVVHTMRAVLESTCWDCCADNRSGKCEDHTHRHIVKVEYMRPGLVARGGLSGFGVLVAPV